MSRVLEYIIKAKDSTAAAVSSAIGRIKGFAVSVARNLMNIKAGLDMLSSAAKSFASVFTKSIGEAFKFEKAVTNFKTLLNSAKDARKHIEELRKFASVTPLTFDDLQGASKLLLSFGAQVDTIMPSLKMLGDIAMGDRSKFQGLALAFAQVKAAGKLMGQDLLQMINQGFNPLTVISKETGKSMSELREMMAKGAISFDMVAEAMRLATSEGGLFNNAMEDAAKTGEGLMSTLEDNWLDAVRTFGNELMDVAKGGIQWCINKLQELKESGAITEWAQRAKEAIYAVMGAFKGLSDETTRGEALGAIKDVVIGGFEEAASSAIDLLKKAAPVIGALIAQGFTSLKDMLADMMSEDAARGWATNDVTERWKNSGRMKNEVKGLGMLGVAGVVPTPDNEEEFRQEVERETQAILEEQKRQKAEEVKRRAEEMSGLYSDDGNKGESRFDRGWNKLKELGRRMQQEMSAIDSTPLTSGEKKKLEYKKPGDLKQMIQGTSADTDEKERIKAEKEIAKERERQWKEYVRQMESDYRTLQSQKHEAESMLEKAEQKSAKAWGWYRDKDSLAAQIEEEKANAAAEKQFDKDFDRLKRRRSDWRTADNLSLDDEAVRRVGVAREEEQAAREYAQQTAEATARAAEALDEIRASIEGGDE